MPAVWNLRHLSLQMDLEVDHMEELSTLRSGIGELTKLRLLRLHLRHIRTMPRLRRCLAVCPAAFQGELQLQGLRGRKVAALDDDYDPPGWRQIGHLTLVECSFTVRICEELAKHIRGGRLNKLEYYECTWRGGSPVPLLNACQSTVRWLDIEEAAEAESEEPFPASGLQYFGNLERLTLRWCSWQSLEALLANSPAGLPELHLCNLFFGFLPVLLDKSPRLHPLPNLIIEVRTDELEMCNGESEAWQQELEAAARLEAYCKGRGIELWPASYQKALTAWMDDGTEHIWHGDRVREGCVERRAGSMCREQVTWKLA